MRVSEKFLLIEKYLEEWADKNSTDCPLLSDKNMLDYVFQLVNNIIEKL